MPRTTQDKFMLRLPDGWRDVIKVRAAKNRRSMNAEILAIIETALQGDGALAEVSEEK
nr:Arc family DNA-binding protein [Cereibacter sphaeroides f. sp. denitrificans]